MTRPTTKAIALTETDRAILANFIISLFAMAGVGFAIGKIIFGV